MPQSTVGVIVSRFQIPELHTGHRYLIEYVQERHENVLVILGTHGEVPTPQNPLPYEVRKAMVLDAYPDVTVAELYDHPIGPNYWCRNLDALVASRFPDAEPTLYGSRDSFLKVYSGPLQTHEVPPIASKSGTDIRKEIGVPSTKEGREALIWQARKRFGLVYRTVDVAIIRPTDHALLLIGKDEHEGLLSFPGGFTEKGESDEEGGERERGEEVIGIRTGSLLYTSSHPINDPRYLNSTDGITTTFFRTWYESGEPKAGDDAKYVAWVPRDKLLEILVPWHLVLGEEILKHI
jgi:ADP-ribose pyrophosphatase YjhB (NUDIX family)